jgi:hypothetical protein
LSRNVFQIEEGVLAFATVDKAAVGYSSTWQAPGGASVDTVTLADYDANSQSWSCQTTSGALNATADTTTTDIPATFCEPAESTPQPGKTTYELAVTFLQDPNVVNGLSRFLFEHDTEEAYFLLGLDGENPPKAIGRVRLAAGTIGGDARTTLTADVTLPLSRKPDIAFGDATESEVVEGGDVGEVFATGATAGTPGTWTPGGSTAPASVAALTAGTPNTVTATPATAWTTGQYVQTETAGTGGRAHWSGSAWVAGAAT